MIVCVQMAWEQRKTYLHIAANVIIASLIYLGFVHQKPSHNGFREFQGSSRSDEQFLVGSRTIPNSPGLEPPRSPGPFECEYLKDCLSHTITHDLFFS